MEKNYSNLYLCFFLLTVIFMVVNVFAFRDVFNAVGPDDDSIFAYGLLTGCAFFLIFGWLVHDIISGEIRHNHALPETVASIVIALACLFFSSSAEAIVVFASAIGLAVVPGALAGVAAYADEMMLKEEDEKEKED